MSEMEKLEQQIKVAQEKQKELKAKQKKLFDINISDVGRYIYDNDREVFERYEQKLAAEKESKAKARREKRNSEKANGSDVANGTNDENKNNNRHENFTNQYNSQDDDLNVFQNNPMYNNRG